MITRARSHGMRVIGATIAPFEGAAYYGPEKEAVRTAVNDWIRPSGAFDGVIDFDQALRDPQRPSRLLPAFDPTDHLHPNLAGHETMAAAIDLAIFD